ncbi:hypothetical protein ACS0TY_004605 [Phlomoides rotata]
MTQLVKLSLRANILNVIPEIPEKILELREQLIPGKTIKNLALEVLDKYGNHAKEDEIISLRVVGFSFQDGSGICQKRAVKCYLDDNFKGNRPMTVYVDAEGFVDLGNALKVSKGYGKDVCLSVISKERVFKNCEAGSQLENIVFEITDSQGKIDESIHGEDKHGKPLSQLSPIHLRLMILWDTASVMDAVLFVLFLSLEKKGLSAAHSHYPELKTVIKGNNLMRILNVAAFAVSGYASVEGRICKPFNPLLGETYEAEYPDKGLRCFMYSQFWNNNIKDVFPVSASGIEQSFRNKFTPPIKDEKTKMSSQKLGETMGFAVGESGTSANDAAGEDEAGEVNVEESILHHTASVGDLVDSKSALADGADY